MMKLYRVESLLRDGLLFVGSLALAAICQLSYMALVPRLPLLPENPLVGVLLATGVVFVFVRLSLQRLTNFLNRTLFFNRHLMRIQLSQLDEEMISTLRLDVLAGLLVERLEAIFKIGKCRLFIWREYRGEFRLHDTKAADGVEQPVLTLQHPVIRSLNLKQKFILYKKSYHFLSWQEAVDVDNFFEINEAKLIMPFFAKEKLMAFLVVGHYQNPGRFQDDISQYYYVISKFAGHAFRNALEVEALPQEGPVGLDSQNDLLQKLKAEAIEKLATGVAHEIRNPLTIISLKTQNLLRKIQQGKADSEAIESGFEIILKQIQRAAAITSRLIHFAKKGQAPEKIILGELFEELTGMLSYRYSLEGVRFVKVVEPDLPVLEAGFADMRELFQNLLLNALESLGGQGTVFVCVRWLPERSRFEVHIADNGTGLDQGVDPARVFDPFFTSKENRNVGLGLYSSQLIVQKYGGSIHVDKNVPTGFVSTVYIPSKGNTAKTPEEGLASGHDRATISFEKIRDQVFFNHDVN